MPYVIDIAPVAFSVLGLHVHWYGIIIAAAVTVAVWLVMREARQRHIAPEARLQARLVSRMYPQLEVSRP